MSGDDLFGGPRASDVPLSRQIACVERELEMRRRVYPRWVDSGKMSARVAAEEILAMQACLGTLLSIQREGRP